MHLDIWSIAILIIVFQGLFLLSVLLLSPKKRTKNGSVYVLAIIVVLIWFLLEFLVVRQAFTIHANIFYGTRYGSWFLLGPLTFFYFKSITDTTWKFSIKEALHFVPFIFFVLILPFIDEDVINTRQVGYGMLSVFDHRKKIISPIQYVYSVIFVLQFIHLGSYLFGNLHLIKAYRQNLKSEYANLDHTIRWAIIFNSILLLVLVFSIVFLYILLVTDIYRRHLDYIYVLPTGVLFYLIGYYLMNAEWQPIQQKNNKYIKSSLKTEHVNTYISQLNSLMKEEKIYLQNEIRLHDIANMMNIPGHHVSQIINEHFESSFFDFINKHRVEEAKKQIINHPRHTLLQIAFDSGFNNKTSFVNAFKKFENTTPSAFRKALLN